MVLLTVLVRFASVFLTSICSCLIEFLLGSSAVHARMFTKGGLGYCFAGYIADLHPRQKCFPTNTNDRTRKTKEQTTVQDKIPKGPSRSHVFMQPPITISVTPIKSQWK